MPGPVRTIELEGSPGRWTFSSARPSPGVTAVAEYWEVQGSLSAFRERILPNARVEVMFNLGPPHRMLRDGRSSAWETAWFSGLHERAISIESLEGTHLVSARLHPIGALALFGLRVPRAANNVVDLEQFLGSGALDLRRALAAAPSSAERFDLLECFLCAQPKADAEPSSLVRDAALCIEAAHGNLRISSLHSELGVSRKHLAMLFAREIGMTPKAFAALHRFVWTLERIRASQAVDWAQLANDAGYSDQSHLARDFRRVADASPTEFLRVRDPESTALLYEA